MWLLVGLGNPGEKYARNRHNIGFMALDTIAARCGPVSFRSKFQGEAAEARIGGHKILLLKPGTYMNNSGQSVGAAAKFYKVEPARIIALHDELDLAAGKIRTKLGGGHAGHNGLRSIDSHLGTQDYHRIRLGIGHPGDKAKVHGHVLSDFGKAEMEWVTPLLQAVARYIDLILDGKDTDFMSKVAMAATA